jgi:hypothetical protein
VNIHDLSPYLSFFSVVLIPASSGSCGGFTPSLLKRRLFLLDSQVHKAFGIGALTLYGHVSWRLGI